MTLPEIIQAARQGNEEAFGNIQEKRVLTIVRTVLGELGRQVKEAKAGDKIVLAGFGTFIIREAKVEKDGQEILQRRILFRNAVPVAGRSGEAGKVPSALVASDARMAPKPDKPAKAGRKAKAAS